MDISPGKFPDSQLYPAGKKPKDFGVAFPALGKARGWIWIPWRPGFGCCSRDFSPAAPPRFPNPSRFLVWHSLDVPVTSLGRSQPLPTPPGLSQSLPEGRTFLDIPIPVIPVMRGNRGIPACTKPRQIHNIPKSPFPAPGTAPAPGKPRFQQIPGNSRSPALRFPNSRAPPRSPPGAHPGFPTCPGCWEGDRDRRSQIPAPIPSVFPGVSRDWEAALTFPEAPGRCWNHFQKSLPGIKKSGKQENSGIRSPARPSRVPRSFGMGRELGRGSQGILPGSGGSPRIPGGAGAAPGARKEPGQEGRSSERRSRGAATPPGNGGTFPSPGCRDPRDSAPIPMIPIPIPLPERFRERWECQEEKQEGEPPIPKFGGGCDAGMGWEFPVGMGK